MGTKKSLFQLVKQPADTVLSVVDVGVDPPLLNWAFLQANWVGSTRADCTKAGACWVFIHERFGQFMYGLYPHDQRWRINGVDHRVGFYCSNVLESAAASRAIHRRPGHHLPDHCLVPAIWRLSWAGSR